MKPILPLLLLLACTSTPIKKVSEPVASVPSNNVKKLLQHSYYLGFFQNDRVKKSFPAVLDLVVKDGKDSEWELHGVLRIFVSTTKVISSYFSRVILHENEIKFTGGEQKIRVVGKSEWRENEISCFVVIYGFGQGKLHLIQRDFVGNNAGSDVSSKAESLSSGPSKKKTLSAETSNPIEGRYPDALSDFKFQRTTFPRHIFHRQMQNKSEEGLLSTSKNLLKQNLFEVNYEKLETSGIYYGIVHHEHQNAFQYVRMTFVVDKEQNRTTAINTLFFSRPEHKEFIVYHYNIEETPQSVIFAGRGETFLAIDKWDKVSITGVWYSKTHGRIGSIFFMRERFPRLAVDAKLVQAIGGRFANIKYIFNLKIENGVSQKDDIVFPSRISGTMIDTVEQKNHQITHGEYNFYRGTVTVSHDSGSVRYSVHEQEPALKIPSIVDEE